MLFAKNKSTQKTRLDWHFDETFTDAATLFQSAQPGGFHLDEECAFLHRERSQPCKQEEAALGGVARKDPPYIVFNMQMERLRDSSI